MRSNVQIHGQDIWFDRSVSVSAAGGDFITIQEAIDSITDATVDKRYVIFVYPGEYVENLTLKNYVYLYGQGARTSIRLITSSGTLVTCPSTGSAIKNMTVYIKDAVDLSIIIKSTTACSMTFYNVRFKITSAINGATAKFLEASDGYFGFRYCRFDYDMDGSAVGVKTHTLFDITGGSWAEMDGCQGNIDLADVDDNLILFSNASTSIGHLRTFGSSFKIDLEDAAYSGTVIGFKQTTATYPIEISKSTLEITSAGNGTAYPAYIDTGGNSGHMHSSENEIRVTGFTNNHSCYVGTTDNIISSGDTITAAQNETLVGTGTVDYFTSSLNNESRAQFIRFDDDANSYVGRAAAPYADWFTFSNDYSNFWLGNSSDPDIWINYEKTSDIHLGYNGKSKVYIYDTTNHTILHQDGIDYKVQVQATNGSIYFEINGTGKTVISNGNVYIGASTTLHPGDVVAFDKYFLINGTLTLETDSVNTPELKFKSNTAINSGVILFKDMGDDNQWTIAGRASDHPTEARELVFAQQHNGGTWYTPIRILPQVNDDMFILNQNGIELNKAAGPAFYLKGNSSTANSGILVFQDDQDDQRWMFFSRGSSHATEARQFKITEYNQGTTWYDPFVIMPATPNNAFILSSTSLNLGVDLDLSGQSLILGSDADGDIYHRASGVLARLPKGTAGQALTMNSGATVPEWQSTIASIFCPAEAAYLPVTNPAALVEEAGATVYAGHSHLAFDDTTSEHAVWRVPVPDYDGGNIVVTAYSKVGATPAGAVTLQYNILTIGLANSEPFDAAVTVDTTVNISHSLNTTELLTDIMVASATIDPANVEADDLLVIELSRDVASDNLVGDGELVGIMLEYTRG